MISGTIAARRVPLSRLARECGGEIHGDGAGVEVTGIAHDSRLVEAGNLFVAVPGASRDGRDFVPSAAAAGAAAIACEQPRREGEASGLPWLRVPSARPALADLSGAFWGHPDRDLTLVGVTGTNGKTSTTWILESLLSSAARPVLLLGSLAYRLGDEQESAERTTPEAPVLGRWLRHAADRGAWGAVMEVSSHALAQERVRGLRFDSAVFTSFDRDHLDFHGDSETYYRAKERLFDEGLDCGGLAVLNADDPVVRRAARACRGRVLFFGRSEDADLRIIEVRPGMEGTDLVLGGIADIRARVPLVGRVNAWNVAAAAAVCVGLGLDPSGIESALPSLGRVPGRMQPVGENRDPAVLVDYAHTPRALENLLAEVRESGARRVLTVFGCGGDRDREKRPLMGAAAAAGSDVVVLTEDNPRGEDPAGIVDEIRAGMGGAPPCEVIVELDRERAFSLALDLARPGDAVVAAGKGAEVYQERGGRKVPWNEVAVLRRLLDRRSRGGRP